MKLLDVEAFPAPLPTFENPWQTTDSRKIYKNPWIDLREDKVITPGGSPGIYSVVDTRIATGVVALDEQFNIYLVGQYRYPTKHYSWEIIEGGSEGDDNALQTAKKELREEAGLEAEHWTQLGAEFHLSNCFSSEIGVVFIAQGLKVVPNSPDDTEQLTLIKIPFSEAILRVESGEIKDAVSIVALMRAKKVLGV